MSKKHLVISKVDALSEMVRAFNDEDFTKSQSIGTMVAQSLQNEYKDGSYLSEIDVNKRTRELFSSDKLRHIIAHS